MGLGGRVALVTGGGTGLGRAISLALADAGCDVAVNYSRSEQEARETAREVEGRGRRALAVQASVTEDGAVRAMVERVAGELGGLDILVNNAGTTRYVPLPELEALTDELWDTILATNLKGPFYCARAAAPHLRAGGRGKIVSTASSSAFKPSGSSIPYMCSKAGLVMLTKSLAAALAPDVQVNAIAPGWLRTRWTDRFVPEEIREKILTDPAFPPVTLEECARMVVTLCESDGITGETIIIDRGRTVL